jgi:hypothetical protein
LAEDWSARAKGAPRAGANAIFPPYASTIPNVGLAKQDRGSSAGVGRFFWCDLADFVAFVDASSQKKNKKQGLLLSKIEDQVIIHFPSNSS